MKWFAGGIAEHLFEEGALTQGVIAAITVDPVFVKFAEAQQLEFALRGDSQPDGPLARHLDAFIANAEQLANGTAGSDASA